MSIYNYINIADFNYNKVEAEIDSKLFIILLSSLGKKYGLLLGASTSPLVHLHR